MLVKNMQNQNSSTNVYNKMNSVASNYGKIMVDLLKVNLLWHYFAKWEL